MTDILNNDELDQDEIRTDHNWWKIGAIVVLVCVIVGVVVGVIGHYAVTPQNSTTASAAVDEKIKGNRNSHIYHWPGCPNYNDISPTNVIWFKTRDEAEAAGYRAARNC